MRATEFTIDTPSSADYPPTPYPGPTPVPMPLPEVRVQAPMVFVPATWEYRHHACPLAEAGGAPTLEILERLGREGWELVGTLGDGQSVHFYLKRETR